MALQPLYGFMMPSISESFSRAYHKQRIAYILPDEIDLAAAPSMLRIEGVGEFKMRHTRRNLDEIDYVYADNHSRQPLYAQPIDPSHPALISRARGLDGITKFCFLLAGAALTAAAIGAGFISAPMSAWALASCLVVGILALTLGAMPDDDTTNLRPVVGQPRWRASNTHP